jgi:methyl-accepting chemotaxis protein
MNFFQNLSVRTKLILLSLIPLLGLLYYLQINIRKELADRNTAQQVIQDVIAINEISKVVHEFQKERALTLTFLADASAEIRREILDQRETTDKAVFSLEKVLQEQQRLIAHY